MSALKLIFTIFKWLFVSLFTLFTLFIILIIATGFTNSDSDIQPPITLTPKQQAIQKLESQCRNIENFPQATRDLKDTCWMVNTYGAEKTVEKIFEYAKSH